MSKERDMNGIRGTTRQCVEARQSIFMRACSSLAHNTSMLSFGPNIPWRCILVFSACELLKLRSQPFYTTMLLMLLQQHQVPATDVAASFSSLFFRVLGRLAHDDVE